MKNVMPVLLAAILVMAVMACGTTSNTTVFVRSTHRVGESRDTILSELGTPDAIFYGSESFPVTATDADAYHVYRKIGLSFRIFGDTVREITLLNEDWMAPNGLMVGMSLEEMLGMLGDPESISESDSKDFYQYPEHNIMVEIYKPAYDVGEIDISEGNTVQL